MSEKQRIAELEAKLTELQGATNNGKDPEMLAKAKDRARMGWMDVSVVLEHLGMDDLGEADVKELQNLLIERKYAQLSGQNKTALSWRA